MSRRRCSAGRCRRSAARGRRSSSRSRRAGRARVPHDLVHRPRVVDHEHHVRRHRGGEERRVVLRSRGRGRGERQQAAEGHFANRSGDSFMAILLHGPRQSGAPDAFSSQATCHRPQLAIIDLLTSIESIPLRRVRLERPAGSPVREVRIAAAELRARPPPPRSSENFGAGSRAPAWPAAASARAPSPLPARALAVTSTAQRRGRAGLSRTVDLDRVRPGLLLRRAPGGDAVDRVDRHAAGASSSEKRSERSPSGSSASNWYGTRRRPAPRFGTPLTSAGCSR